MGQLLLHNARVIHKTGVRHGGLLVRDGHVAEVFDQEERPSGISAGDTVDLNGEYLAPGFIDIHIHGSIGVDVQATDSEGLRRLSNFLLGEGVTGYFATLVPTDERGYIEALETIAAWIEGQDTSPGARILGVHFEGPFVNQQRCGVLQPEYFRTYDGDPRSIEVFTSNGPSCARLMTLAPEVLGGLELTRELAHKGVRVFVGHSQADHETLDRAAEAGARHITHFPNALEPLHHRKPGAVGWGLVRQDITLDCIADLQHVHPLMLRLMYQSKGADQMALISDAISPTGLGDGQFSVWGERINVTGGRTALARSEGTLAGSVITMRQAVKNIAGLGMPIHEAVRMASLVPARVAGVDSQFGSIEQGKLADLIAFDDDFKVRLAAVNGNVLRFE